MNLEIIEKLKYRKDYCYAGTSLPIQQEWYCQSSLVSERHHQKFEWWNTLHDLFNLYISDRQQHAFHLQHVKVVDIEKVFLTAWKKKTIHIYQNLKEESSYKALDKHSRAGRYFVMKTHTIYSFNSCSFLFHAVKKSITYKCVKSQNWDIPCTSFLINLRHRVQIRSIRSVQYSTQNHILRIEENGYGLCARHCSFISSEKLQH